MAPSDRLRQKKSTIHRLLFKSVYILFFHPSIYEKVYAIHTTGVFRK